MAIKCQALPIGQPKLARHNPVYCVLSFYCNFDMNEVLSSPIPVQRLSQILSPVDFIAISEGRVWLASYKSACVRHA